MLSKFIKKKAKYKSSGEILSHSEYCKVSQASNEIMLDRFYKGKEIGFPFV